MKQGGQGRPLSPAGFEQRPEVSKGDAHWEQRFPDELGDLAGFATSALIDIFLLWGLSCVL